MATINQLVTSPRRGTKPRARSRRSKAARRSAGVCTRVYTTTPKKPNSALRKVARVRLTNSQGK